MSKFKQVAESLINKRKNNICNDYNLAKALPEFCVQLLSVTNAKTFEKLFKKIKTSPIEWINEFIQKHGFFAFLNSLEKISNKNIHVFAKSLLLVKCLKSVKELMNRNIGMKFLVDLATIDGNDCIKIFSKGYLMIICFSKLFA